MQFSEDNLNTLADCPRCGSYIYQHLNTHSYCADCNYYELDDKSSMKESVLNNKTDDRHDSEEF